MARASTFAARPSWSKQETAQPIYAKPELIFRPRPARGPQYTVTSKGK